MSLKQRERLGYVCAVLVLIVGGALIRTALLNWVCGPVSVVAVLMIFTRDRRR